MPGEMCGGESRHLASSTFGTTISMALRIRPKKRSFVSVIIASSVCATFKSSNAASDPM